MDSFSSLHWLVVLVALAVKGGLACIPAFIAKDKGRAFTPWFIYGAFLFTIATIHSLFLKPTGEALVRHEAKVRELSAHEGGRDCPACGAQMRPEIETCGACGAAMAPA